MKMRLIRTKAAALALAVAGVLGAAQDVVAQSGEIFVPVLVYRTGAYAPNGVPWADGFVDYLKLVNARDGGANGIRIAFEECETGYATDRGVECYERLKSKKPVVVNPLSTGITYALTEKVPNDKIVLFTTGYGRADSVDGSVFHWNFPLLGTYWDAADMLVQHVKKKGPLKGKKIALVYHDSPYGKEPIKLLEERAKREGFQLILLPVTHPGVEQKATWLQVRQQRPDYVFLWGWGVMNSTSIKEAIAVSYPRLQMYGVWWSSAEPDVTPAEQASKGFNGIALGHSDEADFPVHKDMIKHLYDKGQGTAKDRKDVGDQAGAVEVRQARGHRRGGPLGGREPEPRRRQDQGARVRRHGPAAQDLVQGPRGRASRARPHVGRQGLELHVGLVPGRLQGDPAPGRHLRQGVCERQEGQREVHVASSQ
jgi:branched-chain amino acid transport system substrate-binding protein